MAGISLESAKRHLDLCLKAEEEVLVNQSYTIAGKTYTRASLGELRKEVQYWENKVATINNAQKHKGRNRVVRVVPRDL